MGEPSSPSGEMSSQAKFEAYKRRFRAARGDPRLIRGNLIPGATVDCREMQGRDARSGTALTLRAPTGNNDGYFMLYGRDGVMRGDVDPVRSEDGYERIFLLSRLTVLKGSFGEDQLQFIADMIETLQNNCTAGRTRPIASFILLEETEVSRG